MADTKRARCRCGKELVVPRGPAGYKAQCPQCGAIVRVRVPGNPPSAKNAPAGASPAPAFDRKEYLEVGARTCSSCDEMMPLGQVICPSCGFDQRQAANEGPA